jgi:hypothetical protein
LILFGVHSLRGPWITLEPEEGPGSSARGVIDRLLIRGAVSFEADPSLEAHTSHGARHQRKLRMDARDVTTQARLYRRPSLYKSTCPGVEVKGVRACLPVHAGGLLAQESTTNYSYLSTPLR